MSHNTESKKLPAVLNPAGPLAQGHGLIKEGNIIVKRNPFQRRQGLRSVNLIILRARTADAPDSEWQIVPPENVPEPIRAPETIKQFCRGNVLEAEHSDGIWYWRAEEIIEEAH